MSSNHGRPRSATPFRTPPRSQVGNPMGSPPWVSSRSPDRPEREDLLGRDFWEISGGNFAGISMNFGWMFFSDFLNYLLVILEMIFGWFNDDLWWFISSYKITICDFGDDFWDDFSLQKMFGISLTMCWNHRHPRVWGCAMDCTRSTLQKCEAVPTVGSKETERLRLQFQSLDWNHPADQRPPEGARKSPRRCRVMRWPGVRIHEKQVKNQNKFAVVHVIWRVWSITKTMHGIFF